MEWFRLSASLRVQKLAMQYPQHAGKYEWFLRLYEAARTNPLVPPSVFERLRAKYPEHIAKGGDAGARIPARTLMANLHIRTCGSRRHRVLGRREDLRADVVPATCSVPSTPRAIHPALTASNISSAGPV